MPIMAIRGCDSWHDMETRLSLDILPQPDELTCGPTCLQAVYRYYDDNISLMLNQGQFLFYSFNTREFVAGDGPTKIRCADIDADGDNDVITLNEGTSSITFLFNNLVQ